MEVQQVLHLHRNRTVKLRRRIKCHNHLQVYNKGLLLDRRRALSKVRLTPQDLQPMATEVNLLNLQLLLVLAKVLV